MTDDTLSAFLEKRIKTQGYKTAEEFLIGIFNKKLIGLLLKASRIDTDTIIRDITEEQLKKLLYVSKYFRTEIQETKGFEQAQVCAGGVRTTEIHPHSMESIYTDGLYLTGELLDIDGMCGGYNLQWAWSTGYIAGKHAAKGN
jgi:predicted Rossmann fold flavoprotein